MTIVLLLVTAIVAVYLVRQWWTAELAAGSRAEAAPLRLPIGRVSPVRIERARRRPPAA